MSFQKLFKYFNGTIISTSFALPTAGAFSVIFILDLNDSDCVMLSFGSSLKYCHKLNNYHYIQLGYTLAL